MDMSEVPEREEKTTSGGYIGKRTGRPIRGLLSGTGASTEEFIKEKRRKGLERRKKLGKYSEE
jgi:hypothetical protein